MNLILNDQGVHLALYSALHTDTKISCCGIFYTMLDNDAPECQYNASCRRDNISWYVSRFSCWKEFP